MITRTQKQASLRSMTDLVPRDDVPADEDGLLEYLGQLIEQARHVASSQVNATLTMRNWLIGRAINTNILGHDRADYGKQIVVSLARQLTERFGPGFDRPTVFRMVQFAQIYPDHEIVVSLARQLSWTHLVAILPLPNEEARDFYVRETVAQTLGVRDLRRSIARKAFERREIANARIQQGSAIPRDTFTDPMILDMLELHDGYLEKDLEAAILRDVQAFLMEVGQGFTFVASQKRMTVSETKLYKLDLLFFSRPLRRLVAVELKLGEFRASYKGQMEGYLKWLDRYERGEGEEAPIGLILCSAADRDEIELLGLHNDRIAVAEYWTLLPPKAELEAKLRQITRDAQERLARRGITAEMEADEEDNA
jgi:predicted nuclease of restriction endonuclease-like (RecB) superfamily